MKIMCLSGATCLPVGSGNEDNVSEWSNMSTCGLLFKSASTIKI